MKKLRQYTWQSESTAKACVEVSVYDLYAGGAAYSMEVNRYPQRSYSKRYYVAEFARAVEKAEKWMKSRFPNVTFNKSVFVKEEN